MKVKTIYKRRAVFVPYCVIAPGCQANSHIQCNYEWRKNFIALFLENDIDIVPFTCSEVSFSSLSLGLLREKHGIDYYNKLSGFITHCDRIASQEAEKMEQMLKAKIQIIGVMGIEHSPCCAVNYLYTHNGMQKRPGLFMQSFINQLETKGIKTDFIGINRKYPNKALKNLRECIEKI